MKNIISKIISDVELHGDSAVARYTHKFDNVKLKPERFIVMKKEIKSKLKSINPDSKRAIENATKRIEKFHYVELKKIAKSWTCKTNDITLGQVINPVESVGIYVPGGRNVLYPSTVLMTAIPARVAQVKKIVVVTPPKNIVPEVLYACSISKVDAIYRVGGVQAIAALAFGTETIPKVDLIVGPGSYYVTEAKKYLYGKVGIDLLAGPTELAIMCDKTANIDYVVYDLLSQAEHSPDSKLYLFCNSNSVLTKVRDRIAKAKGLTKQFNFINCSLRESVEKINNIAPEHLQIMIKNPEKVLQKTRNAGAVLLGEFSPTALSDYFAGPSHVLPTDGSAKFSSGISVQTFLKRTNVIKFNLNSLKKVSKDVITLANIENLKFHAESVKIRFHKKCGQKLNELQKKLKFS